MTMSQLISVRTRCISVISEIKCQFEKSHHPNKTNIRNKCRKILRRTYGRNNKKILKNQSYLDEYMTLRILNVIRNDFMEKLKYTKRVDECIRNNVVMYLATLLVFTKQYNAKDMNIMLYNMYENHN